VHPQSHESERKNTQFQAPETPEKCTKVLPQSTLCYETFPTRVKAVVDRLPSEGEEEKSRIDAICR
jgi:hypothetical protein